MSIKITKDNYSTYKMVYEIITHRLYKDLNFVLPEEANPVSVLNSWEAKSMSLARRGLQAGLNDHLATINHFSREALSDINAELERNSLPNIYTLSGIIQKTISRVLKAKKIKNIDQYYIVKEVLNNTTREISIDDRNSLSDCLLDFEYKDKK